jgi:hypothetical protein
MGACASWAGPGFGYDRNQYRIFAVGRFRMYAGKQIFKGHFFSFFLYDNWNSANTAAGGKTPGV